MVTRLVLLAVIALAAASSLEEVGQASRRVVRGHTSSGPDAQQQVLVSAHASAGVTGAARQLAEVVIASNRGPINWAFDAARDLVPGRAGGGLATGMAPLIEGNDGARWIASAVSDADRRAAELGRQAEGFAVDSVLVDPRQYQLAYNVVSNEALWFAHHGMWDGVRTPRFYFDFEDAWSAYRELNAAFARRIDASASRGAKVLVQDYHLALTAEELRKLGRDDLLITHFSHTPFGSADDISRLPDVAGHELMRGMAAFDAAGFHTTRWQKRFTHAMDEFGFEAPNSYVSPLGIDANNIRRIAYSDEANRYVEEFREQFKGRKVIARTDRIEPTKNIVSGFEAYELLLERHPDLRDDVVFVAQVFPSRTDVDEYIRYNQAVVDVAARINRRFGTENWTPVVLLNDKNDMARGMAAIRVADAVLINPIRDGLNLVAKETTIIGEKNPALVLSKEAGAWDELGKGYDGALGVNPTDIAQTTNTLFQALTMAEGERTARMSAMRRVVERGTPEKWLERQLHAATR